MWSLWSSQSPTLIASTTLALTPPGKDPDEAPALEHSPGDAELVGTEAREGAAEEFIVEVHVPFSPEFGRGRDRYGRAGGEAARKSILCTCGGPPGGGSGTSWELESVPETPLARDARRASIP
jgi:hypothetical protein